MFRFASLSYHRLAIALAIPAIPLLQTACDIGFGSAAWPTTGATAPPETWRQVFDGGGDEFGNAVTVDGAGAAIAGGTAPNGLNLDGLIRKYDDSGLIWSASFDNGLDDQTFAVATDGNDNVLAAGSSANAADNDLWVRKLDRNGNELWTRIFDGGGDDTAYGVVADSANNVVVVGEATIPGGATRIVVRKYNSAGALQWSEVAGSGTTAQARGVAVDSRDNIVVTGRVGSGTARDVYVAQFAPNGTLNWERTFDSGGDDEGRGVAVGRSDDVVVTGRSLTAGGNGDTFLGTWSSTGDPIWTRVDDMGPSDEGNAVAIDRAGNILVAGQVKNAANADAYIRKSDRAGNEVWKLIDDHGPMDVANGVATDPACNIYIAGTSFNGSDLDLFVAKFEHQVEEIDDDPFAIIVDARDQVVSLLADPNLEKKTRKALCDAQGELERTLRSFLRGEPKEIIRHMRHAIDVLGEIRDLDTGELQRRIAQAATLVLAHHIDRVAAVVPDGQRELLAGRQAYTRARELAAAGDYHGAAKQAESGAKRLRGKRVRIRGNFCPPAPTRKDLIRLCELLDLAGELTARANSSRDRHLKKASRELEKAAQEAVSNKEEKVVDKIRKAVESLARSREAVTSFQSRLVGQSAARCADYLDRAAEADLDPKGLEKGLKSFAQGQAAQAAGDWKTAAKRFRDAIKRAKP